MHRLLFTQPWRLFCFGIICQHSPKQCKHTENVSWYVAPTSWSPMGLMLTASYSAVVLLEWMAGAFALTIQCCHGQVYIGISWQPSSPHTGAKGCLVHLYKTLRGLTKPWYLRTREWQWLADFPSKFIRLLWLYFLFGNSCQQLSLWKKQNTNEQWDCHHWQLNGIHNKWKHSCQLEEALFRQTEEEPAWIVSLIPRIQGRPSYRRW